ncbi:MAG: DNA-3-methyladenine glycosylase [Candidatus Kapaibacteriota bacterium]
MKFEIDYSKHLSKEFFLNPTEWVAKNLIGKVLVRVINGVYTAAMIVEAEAYLAEFDSASHSAIGKTRRNSTMFEEGGVIYVYKIYGIHHCVNIVTENQGKGCAVLIRAGQPLVGIGVFKSFRGDVSNEKLLRGPGNFAKAFAFTKSDDGASILLPDLFVQDFIQFSEEEIGISQRIGIVRAKELPLRFYLRSSKYVSASPRD